jgi:hypothetical protein
MQDDQIKQNAKNIQEITGTLGSLESSFTVMAETISAKRRATDAESSNTKLYAGLGALVALAMLIGFGYQAVDSIVTKATSAIIQRLDKLVISNENNTAVNHAQNLILKEHGMKIEALENVQ